MIERSEIDSNAVEIKSQVYMVRAMKHGDKMLFSANDILSACGIKAAGKWLERNARQRPDLITVKLPYPVRAGNSYRRVGMIFVTAAVGKRLVRITACQADTKKWLMEEVFSYRVGDDEPYDVLGEEQKGENAASEEIGRIENRDRHLPAESLDMKSEDMSKMIDNILIELLEIKRFVSSGRSAG